VQGPAVVCRERNIANAARKYCGVCVCKASAVQAEADSGLGVPALITYGTPRGLNL